MIQAIFRAILESQKTLAERTEFPYALFPNTKSSPTISTRMEHLLQPVNLHTS